MNQRAAPPISVSCECDIRPLFRPEDVEHTRALGMDLAERDKVRDAAHMIAAGAEKQRPHTSETRRSTLDSPR
jgi:hypothetical protein